MFFAYVLYSEKFDKIYIGFTSNLEQRLLSHNQLGNGYTKKFRPWTVVLKEVFFSKKEAMLREKYLKSGVGREFIWNFIRNEV